LVWEDLIADPQYFYTQEYEDRGRVREYIPTEKELLESKKPLLHLDEDVVTVVEFCKFIMRYVDVSYRDVYACMHVERHLYSNSLRLLACTQTHHGVPIVSTLENITSNCRRKSLGEIWESQTLQLYFTAYPVIQRDRYATNMILMAFLLSMVLRRASVMRKMSSFA